MRNIGFTIATSGLVIALAAGGYFALTSMTDPGHYAQGNEQSIGDLYAVQTTKDTPAPVFDEPETTAAPVTTQTPADTKPAPVQTSNDLASRIQSLIDQKIVLKAGSKGANVGTIQEFMNKYLAKTLKIDNDFGKTLEANVKTFQAQNKISATGQVGPQTLAKMKAWLASH